MKKHKTIWRNAALVSAIISLSSTALGSAFQINDESVSGAGNAHADAAAGAYDASTAYYNPAGLSLIHGQQFVIGGSLFQTQEKFSGTAYTKITPPAGRVFEGTGTIKADNLVFIPQLHYAASVNDNLTLAFSVDSPFQFANDWGSNFLKYSAIESSIKTTDLSPSFGLAFNDKLSVGAGFDAEKMRAHFSQIFGDSGDGLNDVLVDNRSSAWGYGWHAGLLYHLQPTTRLGVAYHSPITFNTKGTSTFTNIGAMPFHADYALPINADIKLPASANLGFAHDLSDKITLLATATYTQWNVLNNITLNNTVVASGTASANTTVLSQNFHNTWQFALGSNYKYTDKLTLQGGVSYEQSPTNNTDRTVRLADENKFGISLGAKYQLVQNVSVNLAYQHLFIHNANINNVNYNALDAVSFYSYAEGQVESAANVFGAQLTWNIT